MSVPRVSVILPVWNAAAFVGEAVRSLLSQDFADFELLALDDGSTDGSAEKIKAAAAGDDRVRIISRPNRGLIATLNEAIEMARGEFLARMDADDISLPQRFSRQVDFLERNPQVAVVGMQTESFGGGMEKKISRHPTEPEAVMCGLVFRNTLSHPTVMMRREIFAGGGGLKYDAAARHVEDYALWIAAAEKGFQLANLPQIGLRYRMHGGQVCAVHGDHQEKAVAGRQLEFLRLRLGVVPASEEAWIHGELSFNRLRGEAGFVERAVSWLKKLAEANERAGGFPREAFLRVLTGRFVSLLRAETADLRADAGENLGPFADYISPEMKAALIEGGRRGME